MSEQPQDDSHRGRGAARLVLGLFWGLALHGLYRAVTEKAWPATDMTMFMPLLAVTFYVPALALSSIGQAQWRALLPWLAGMAALVALLALHLALRVGQETPPTYPFVWSFGTFALPPLLLLAYGLAVPAMAERRWVASYAAQFDAAWKLVLQHAVASIFAGLLIGILFLGSALLQLVNIDLLKDLLRKSWFTIPMAALAFAAAIHVSDVRPAILRGLRTLLLSLLAWLLPVVLLLVVPFLVALSFTGLQKLSVTGSAAGTVLSMAVLLVVLINAVWQDGEPERRASRVLLVAARLAIVILPILAGIAAYALLLRVRQYGWTQDRILMTAAVLLALYHGIGYATVMVYGRGSLERVRTVNVAGAALNILVIVALGTPLADPARLAVNSQVKRLLSGQVTPTRFDWDYLGFETGRYGQDALAVLRREDGGAPDQIRELANAALVRSSLTGSRVLRAPSATDIAKAIIVYPRGQELPTGFAAQTWRPHANSHILPRCLLDIGWSCDAFMRDLNDDGRLDLILVEVGGATSLRTGVFERTGSTWDLAATIPNLHRCKQQLDALRAGRGTIDQGNWGRLRIDGFSFPLVEILKPSAQPPC